MATTAFTEFLPEVLPSVPACAEPLAVNAVRNAAIEFCSNTLFWQETQADTAITVAVTPSAPLTLSAPTGARIIQIMAVTIDGLPLSPISIDMLDDGVYNWRGRTGKPSAFYQPNPDQLVFVLPPDASYTATLRVAYSPTRVADGVDERIYQNYLEAVSFGAVARLAAIPGQAFSNPEVASYARAMFNNAMTDATIEANKSYTRGSPQIQMRVVR